jgi:hypothetical protein
MLLHWYLHFYNYGGGHGLGMYRKEAVLAHGGYRDISWCRHCEDYELWTRLARPGSVIFLPHKLLLWRRHDAAIGIRYASDQEANVIRVAANMQSELLGKTVTFGDAQAAYYYWTQPNERLTAWPRVETHLRNMLAAYLASHVRPNERKNIEELILREFKTASIAGENCDGFGS